MTCPVFVGQKPVECGSISAGWRAPALTETPTLDEPHADVLKEFNLVATSHLDDCFANVWDETQHLRCEGGAV